MAKWLFCLGLLLCLVSLVYDQEFAGIPYQDPPSDLEVRYQFHADVAKRIMFAGLGALAVACSWSRGASVSRRLRTSR
jgi:hypothetical protein